MFAFTLLTVLLCLSGVGRVQAQIRIPWGWTAPCKVLPNDTATKELFSINFLDNCDMWHAPHLTNPFLLMILTSNPWASFLVPGAFEIWEALIGTIYHAAGVRVTDNVNYYENIPDILIDDWLIQATLGILLAAWMLWVFRAPVLWRGWYTDRGLFMRWLLWFVALMLCQHPYGEYLNGPSDPIGFPLYQTVTIVLMCVLFALLIQTEPGMERAWDGRTHRSRLEFWMAVIVVHFSFYYVVQFDFFFGSAAQTWLLWITWMTVWFLVAVVAMGRAREILRLLDWQGNYLRERARRLHSSPP